MKTSEFIRNAVDLHLAPDYQTYRDDVTGSVQTPHLCNVITRYHMFTDSKYSEQCRKADKLISECLRDVKPSASIKTSLGISSETEAQEVRFMCAEFMALYFEDQGD